jgi:hypothetical protein
VSQTLSATADKVRRPLAAAAFYLGALPITGEHLLVVAPEDARACDVCAAAHAVLVVRQVGAEITATCCGCAPPPKESRA